MIEDRFVVSDGLWMRLEPYLPGKASDSGVTAKDNRLFLEAVLWRVRPGAICHQSSETGTLNFGGSADGRRRVFLSFFSKP